MYLNIIVIVFIVFLIDYCLAGGLIVEGDLAPEGSFQHSVSFGLDCLIDSKRKSFGCCGSVISQRVVLSAAHCFRCESVKAVVKVGSVDLAKAQSIPYSHHITHPRFKYMKLQHDICLIFLKKDIDFVNVKKVALMAYPLVGEAYVAGWGQRTLKVFKYQRYLRYVRQKILSPEECKHKIESIRNGTFCTTPYDDEKGHGARGDSGAALIVQGYIQVGIHSYRPKQVPRVAVYTYVPRYLKWINKNINSFYCPE